MRIVLLGDSHLARVRRDLALVGPDVHNAAVGGATSHDLAVCRDLDVHVVHAEQVVAPLGAGAFVDDGLHLTGDAYRLLLPAIAAGVRAAG
ncbi:hypothetical protein [Nocardioides zeicaulis]|uniref:SGNH/GDSL hydrolase family protein n=1 Tax=Nocardioides zeicaulis TaxID=1776857 RepID=A0ABV6E5A9_9ACTN